MRNSLRRKIGIALVALGALVIFLSACLNASIGPVTGIHDESLKNVYMYDILSGAGIFLIPWGLVLCWSEKGKVT